MKHKLVVLLLLLTALAHDAGSQATARYDTLVQQGNAQLQAGNPSEALEIGQRATKLAPEKWQAYALTGGALMNLKRYEEAADQFSEGIRLAPESKKLQLRDLRKQCVMAEEGALSPVPAASQPAAVSGTATTTQAEVVLWKSIETSSDRTSFEAYLQQYPSGAYAALAKLKLDQLVAEQAQAERARQAQAAEAARQAEIKRFDIPAMHLRSFNGSWGHLKVTDDSIVYEAAGDSFTISKSEVVELHYQGFGGNPAIQFVRSNGKKESFYAITSEALASQTKKDFKFYDPKLIADAVTARWGYIKQSGDDFFNRIH